MNPQLRSPHGGNCLNLGCHLYIGTYKWVQGMGRWLYQKVKIKVWVPDSWKKKSHREIACNPGTEWVEDRRFGGCKVSSRSTWLNWWDPSSERDPVSKHKVEDDWGRQAWSSGLHMSVHTHTHTHKFQRCTFDEHVSNSLFTLMLFTVWLLIISYRLLLLRRPISWIPYALLPVFQ